MNTSISETHLVDLDQLRSQIVLESKGNPFSTAKQYVSSLEFDGLEIPERNRAVNCLNCAECMEWQFDNLLEKARENTAGYLLSTINQIPKQANKHLQQLEYNCNLNKGEIVVNDLYNNGHDAKPFAVCEQTSDSLEVKGDGYNWKLSSIDISEEAIPPKHLLNLSLIRAKGIEPDSIYIAVPFARKGSSISKAISNEIQMFKTFVSKANNNVKTGLRVMSENIKLPDPVLIVGFGNKPVILIEIGRWI